MSHQTAGAARDTDVARVYGDDDADLALLQDRNVTLLGYDDTARAFALCLRDSGVDLRVGAPAGSDQAQRAVADGLRVLPPYDACEEADLLVVLGRADPDSAEEEAIRGSLVAGDAVVLGPDADADAGRDVPDGVDVVRVVPWGPADQLRREYTRGRGLAAFVSVRADASGRALDLALACARALGATRTGVLEVGEDDLAAAADAARRLADDVLGLARRTFDVLLAGGCPPALAYRASFAALDTLAADLSAGRLDTTLDGSVAEAVASVRSLTPRQSRIEAGQD